jgi:hypothetical protein
MTYRWKALAAFTVLAIAAGPWIVPNINIAGIFYHAPLEELLKFIVAYVRPAATLILSAAWFGALEGFFKVVFVLLTLPIRDVLTVDGSIVGLVIVVTSLFHVITGYAYYSLRSATGSLVALQLAANTALHMLMNWSQEQLNPNGLMNMTRRMSRAELVDSLGVNCIICALAWCIFCLLRSQIDVAEAARS